MATIQISLPESMKLFIEKQSRAEGFGTVSEYIWSVIRELQRLAAQNGLEELLLAGVRSPTQRGTDHFWNDLETKVGTVRKRR
jgi:antitoxin ParD1/3/4